MLNSRLGLFTAAPFSSSRRGFTYRGHSFSRSYGVNLPSSLTRVLSRTLEYSSRLPVLVCGTDTCKTHIEVFLDSGIRSSLWARPSYSALRIVIQRICLSDLPTTLNQHFQSLAELSLLCSPYTQTRYKWYGNIKPVSHRLRLSASP